MVAFFLPKRTEIQKEGERKREEGEEERVSKGRGSLNPSFLLSSCQPRQSIAVKWALKMEALLYVPLKSSQSQYTGRGQAAGLLGAGYLADIELNLKPRM